MTSPEKTASALTTARRLAARGIPIFIAHPALGADGQWDPKGGGGQSGYVLPAGWQATTPDPAVVDTWRPGDALAAVMGAPGPVDCLDVDPRNGGDATAHQWGGAGAVSYTHLDVYKRQVAQCRKLNPSALISR